MKLQITHVTHYDYVPVVETAQHMAYFQPLDSSCQQLLSHSLQISPTPAQTRLSLDVFGNTRCFFSLQMPHPELDVVARSVVATTAQPRPESRIGWEHTTELFRYASGGRFESASEFVFASPHVPRHADFLAYARPSFLPGASLLEAATDLMQRIHADFRYVSHSTEVDTPALEALAQRRGVCQDFAHIMLACLRAKGIGETRVLVFHVARNAVIPTLALSLGYKFTEQVSVTFDASNLNNPVRHTYMLTENAPSNWYESGRQYYVNVRMKF